MMTRGVRAGLVIATLAAVSGMAAGADVAGGAAEGGGARGAPAPAPVAAGAAGAAGADVAARAGSPVAANWHLLNDYCVKCHNATDWAGGLAFDTMSPDSVAADGEIWEKAM